MGLGTRQGRNKTKHLDIAEYKVKKIIKNAIMEAADITVEAEAKLQAINQALEQAKSGEIARSKSGLKAQIVALTIENKNLTEENERLKKDNGYLFTFYQREKKTHANYDKAIRALSLFRTQEPEAFARVLYRSISVLQPFLPVGELPAPLGRNCLREIEEEIRNE